MGNNTIITPLRDPVKSAVSAGQAVPKTDTVTSVASNVNKLIGVAGPAVKAGIDAAERRDIFSQIEEVASTEDRKIAEADAIINDLADSLGGPPTEEEQTEFIDTLDKLEKIKAAARQRMSDGTAMSYTIAKGRELILAGKNPDVVRHALTVFTTGLGTKARQKKEELPKFEKDTREKWYVVSRGQTDYTSPEYLRFREREFDLKNKERQIEEGTISFEDFSANALDLVRERSAQALDGAAYIVQNTDPQSGLEYLTSLKQQMVQMFAGTQTKVTQYVTKSTADGVIVTEAKKAGLQQHLAQAEKTAMQRIDSLIQAQRAVLEGKTDALRNMVENLELANRAKEALRVNADMFEQLTQNMDDKQKAVMTRIWNSTSALGQSPDDQTIQKTLSDSKLQAQRLGIPANVVNQITPEVVKTSTDALILLSQEDFVQEALAGGHVVPATPVASRFLRNMYGKSKKDFVDILASTDVNSGKPGHNTIVVDAAKQGVSTNAVPDNGPPLEPDGTESTWSKPNVARATDNAVAVTIAGVQDVNEFTGTLLSQDSVALYQGLLKAKQNGAVMSDYNMYKVGLNKWFTFKNRVLTDVQKSFTVGPRRYEFSVDPRTLTVKVRTFVDDTELPVTSDTKVFPERVQRQLDVLNDFLSVMDKDKPYSQLFDDSRPKVLKAIGEALNEQDEEVTKKKNDRKVFVKAMQDAAAQQ